MSKLIHPRLHLGAEEIFRAMGSGSQDPSPEMLETIGEVRIKALKLVQARFIYDILPVNTDNGIILGSRFPFRCSPAFFRGATHAALLIGTVGPLLEQESSRLFREGDFLAGMLMDACGTACLDKILGLARAEISKALNGFKLGYTLSPGCQAVPLEEQVTIFSLLAFEEVEVGLSDSCMMVPGKSLSAVIPLGRELLMTSGSNYACEVCGLQNSCTFSPAAGNA